MTRRVRDRYVIEPQCHEIENMLQTCSFREAKVFFLSTFLPFSYLALNRESRAVGE